MACYVDQIREYSKIKYVARRWGIFWCHLMCDTTEELEAMARKLGLHPAYRQHSSTITEHYDLIPVKRKAAIKLGAIETSLREMVAKKGNIGAETSDT